MDFGLILLAVFLYSIAFIITLFLILFILGTALRKNFFIRIKEYVFSILLGSSMYLVWYLVIIILFYTPLRWIPNFDADISYLLFFIFLPLMLIIKSRKLKKMVLTSFDKIVILSLAIVSTFLEPIFFLRLPFFHETAMFPLPISIWKYYPLLILFFISYELKIKKISFANFGILLSVILLIFTTFTAPIKFVAKPDGSISVKGIIFSSNTNHNNNGIIKTGRAFPFVPINATFIRGKVEKKISFFATPGKEAQITATFYTEGQSLKWLKELEIPINGKHISCVQLFLYDDSHLLVMPLGIGNLIFLLDTKKGEFIKEIHLNGVLEDVTFGTILSKNLQSISILHQLAIFTFDLSGNLIKRIDMNQINYSGIVIGFAGYNDKTYIIDEKYLYFFENGKLLNKFEHKLNMYSTNKPNQMIVNNEGVVFIAIRNVVYELKANQFVEYIKLPDSNSHIQSICFDETGSLYAFCLNDVNPPTLTLTKVTSDKKIKTLKDLSSIYADGVIVLSNTNELIDTFSTSGFLVNDRKAFVSYVKGEPSGKIVRVAIKIYEDLSN